jgi:hypothetical protein
VSATRSRKERVSARAHAKRHVDRGCVYEGQHVRRALTDLSSGMGDIQTRERAVVDGYHA